MTRLYSFVGSPRVVRRDRRAQQRFNEDLRYGGVVYNGIDMGAYPLQGGQGGLRPVPRGARLPRRGWRRAIEAAAASGERLVSAVKIAHPTEQEEWTNNIQPILPSDSEVLGEIAPGGEGQPAAPSQGCPVPDRLGRAVPGS